MVAVTCCRTATRSWAASFGRPLAAGGEVPAFTSQKSQSERPRGTLGTFDQRIACRSGSRSGRSRCIAWCRIIWNIITRNEITNSRTICCCCRSLLGRRVREAQSVVESGSAAYSNITAATSISIFYHKGSIFYHKGSQLTKVAYFAPRSSLGTCTVNLRPPRDSSAASIRINLAV
jgi:hypothetical protein